MPIDLKSIEAIVTSNSVWAVVCVVIVIAFWRSNQADKQRLIKQNDARERNLAKHYETNKQESREREDKLMNHLERTTEQLENTSKTLVSIERGLVSLEKKTEGGFSEIWEQIDTIKKGEI